MVEKKEKRDLLFYLKEFQGLFLILIGIAMIFNEKSKWWAGFIIGIGMARLK